MTGAQRGFALAETLLAFVLTVTIGLIVVATMRAMTGSLAVAHAGGGAAAIDGVLAALRADAASAYAVYVPDRDVFGNPNAPPPPAPAPSGAPPHEVDFYARTQTGAELWWAYAYDRASGTLQRFDIDPNTRALGVADRTTGIVNPRARYAAVGGVTAFAAQRRTASDLAGPAGAYGSLFGSLFAAAGVAPVAAPVGFVPRSGVPRDDVYGGNASVEVTLAGARGARIAHLVAGVLPSGFTVHARPAMRAFVYRIDIVHRFWFGLAQITHAQIFEQLQYSFDPAQPRSWHVWCDSELYGNGISGLRLWDPNVHYHPGQFAEAMAGIYYADTHDGFAGHVPAGCSDALPRANAPVPTPLPSATNPDIVDTPPPCWYAGRCWPPQAPPDWAPPSPWPSASPPPAWCATHRRSPLCGAA